MVSQFASPEYSCHAPRAGKTSKLAALLRSTVDRKGCYFARAAEVFFFVKVCLEKQKSFDKLLSLEFQFKCIAIVFLGTK